MIDQERDETRRQFDLEMMAICLELAQQAVTLGEIPVGALITANGQILAQGHNLCESLTDPTAHAERLIIAQACQVRQSQRLDGCTLYTTLEPCVMCAGAIVSSRLDRLVYGASDLKSGATRSLYRLLEDSRLNHQVHVTADLAQDLSVAILQSFFRQRRETKK